MGTCVANGEAEVERTEGIKSTVDNNVLGEDGIWLGISGEISLSTGT